MYRIITLILLCVNFSNAQILPQFVNDTLYTKCGYRIYKGQILQFGEGTGKNGEFRYLKARGIDKPSKFRNQKVLVENVSDFYISGLDNAYIKIKGTVTKGDGTKKKLKFKLIFDKAIGEIQGIEPEIIVPEEFRCKFYSSKANEIEKLFNLYQKGIIDKEQFEIEKKKLLEK